MVSELPLKIGALKGPLAANSTAAKSGSTCLTPTVRPNQLLVGSGPVTALPGSVGHRVPRPTVEGFKQATNVIACDCHRYYLLVVVHHRHHG